MELVCLWFVQWQRICKFSWIQLWPRYFIYVTQTGCVDYPWGIDMPGHEIFVLWPLSLKPWPWPWDYCGCCCLQGIDGNIANLLLATTHEGEMCMGMEFWSCDVWPWSHDLDHGILMDAAVSKVLMLTWQMLCLWATHEGACSWHQIFFLWLFTLELWPWPWDCCGCCCVQSIDANVAELFLWSTHEKADVHGPGIFVCDLWPWVWDSEFLVAWDLPICMTLVCFDFILPKIVLSTAVLLGPTGLVLFVFTTVQSFNALDDDVISFSSYVQVHCY